MADDKGALKARNPLGDRSVTITPREVQPSLQPRRDPLTSRPDPPRFPRSSRGGQATPRQTLTAAKNPLKGRPNACQETQRPAKDPAASGKTGHAKRRGQRSPA